MALELRKLRFPSPAHRAPEKTPKPYCGFTIPLILIRQPCLGILQNKAGTNLLDLTCCHPPRQVGAQKKPFSVSSFIFWLAVADKKVLALNQGMMAVVHLQAHTKHFTTGAQPGKVWSR
jgi:hypothetical protein